LGFEDESGFSLVSPLKRTWAPCGETPVVRTSIAHHDRVNVIGAVFLTPGGQRLRLHVQLHAHYITGHQILGFLAHVLRRRRGPLVLVWDNPPTHRRKMVQQFLARHPRLHVFPLPSYAPELNPAEYLWTQTAEYTAGTAPRSADELRGNVVAGLRRLRRSQARLRACLAASALSWNRKKSRRS
jgi:transposase